MAVSTAVITAVVVSLLYCISPGELETVGTVISYRVSSQASRLLETVSDNGAQVVDEVRQLFNPDPFRPNNRPDSPVRWQPLPGWLWGPLPIAAWVTGLLCAGTYIRKRWYRFASEGKRANVLARAVRRMGEPEDAVPAKVKIRQPREGRTNESDNGLFHAGGNSLDRVHDAAIEARGSGDGAPPPLCRPPGESTRPFA